MSKQDFAYAAEIRTLLDLIEKKDQQIKETLKEIDSYCDGCSRFKDNKCVLKKAWSCQILKIRMTLAGEKTEK